MSRKNTKEITSALCQYMSRVRRSWVNIPNCYIYGECDLLSIMPNKTLHEFEIKISRNDFLRDIRAYEHVAGGDKASSPKQKKHYALHNAKARINNKPVPNHYSFCVPEELVESCMDDLPSYSGLYTYDENYRFKCIVRETLIHTTQILDKDVIQLLRNLHFRYWKLWSGV